MIYIFQILQTVIFVLHFSMASRRDHRSCTVARRNQREVRTRTVYMTPHELGIYIQVDIGVCKLKLTRTIMCHACVCVSCFNLCLDRHAD
uniref:Secreted protein n=1 Tax=Setaria viridis TaxID=4556 RepID=A0A4U6V790_SETVI|nr:hypothetical protein SEVIR_3G091550v2 [Setaria viridis]